MKTVREADVRGKRVFLRVDFNIPVEELISAAVRKDFRIQRSRSALDYLISQKAKIILATHLGRPEGRDENLSTKLFVDPLEKLLKKEIRFVPDIMGEKVKEAVDALGEGEVLLIENLRFHLGEEANDEDFAKKLAELADIYVNEAFSVSHRSHASVAAVTKFLPAYAGFVLEEEVKNLSKVLKFEKHPQVIVLGGSKAETKFKLIRNFLDRADQILIGGVLANIIFKLKGFEVGKSKLDFKDLDFKEDFEKLIAEPKIFLPEDIVSSHSIDERSPLHIWPADKAQPDEYILDIGPESVKHFSEVIQKAKLIVWNGLLGLAEKENFSAGSQGIAVAMDRSQAFKVVGGGDTVAFIQKLGLADKFSFLSTGGGAMLEFLAGEKLPGLEALDYYS